MMLIDLTQGMIARIGPRNDHKTIGYFKSAEDAACAYDREAIKLYGDDAVTNFKKEKTNE